MARPQPLVAGNWKMNGMLADLAEIEAVRDAVDAGGGGGAEVLICPPATLIVAAAKLVQGSRLKIGGQTCRSEISGAHTGDVSAAMLKDAGATYVILGHSERRASYGETNAAVRARAISALDLGMSAIICVGETKAEREAGRATSIVGRQLLGSVPAHPDPSRLVIAYEPVWAIGTGLTPTNADVAAMHRFIRGEIERLVPAGGSDVRLLYGGSVRPRNAAELMAIADVDGGLIGGASLDVDDFMAIAGVYREDVKAAASA
ncbi:triose-phosphate isomerase [Beijerinckia sp. L45]|uniref:triose-phosphate isomerase n=1 Tax=Beijerinckia sp. L45 TaxID=1641855 RepID=UPI00131BBACC|nr:triose-phosphate isomerase [Beijerinckia sp. L45]